MNGAEKLRNVLLDCDFNKFQLNQKSIKELSDLNIIMLYAIIQLKSDELVYNVCMEKI